MRTLLLLVASLVCPQCLVAQQANPGAQQTNMFDNISFAELNRRANAGNAAAQEQLGDCYFLGFPVGLSDGAEIKQDFSKAAAWFQKAATQGYAPAELDLSMAYRYGRGVAKDKTLAVDWLQKAAGSGYANAQYSLGIVYLEGYLVPKDIDMAVLFVQLAANQGNANAQADLKSLIALQAAMARLEESSKEIQKFITDNDTSTPATSPVTSTDATSIAAETGKLAAAKPAAAPLPATPEPTPSRGFAPIPVAGASSSAAPPAIPYNYALIFATNDYAQWPHLNNPISDADAVNETLTSLYNFQVEEVRNPTGDQILAKLTEYLHRKFEPQDQLFILFSGHGYFDSDLHEGFLVPADGRLVQDDVSHRTLLDHSTVKQYVDRIPSQHVILVMDACFSGTFDRRIADGGMRGNVSDVYVHATLPELLARKENKRTRRYFTSGGNEYVPDGRPGHHTPFISALLVTLNRAADNKGYVTLNDIQQGFETVAPEPKWGDISDDNDPTSDFLLLTSDAIAKLNKPN